MKKSTLLLTLALLLTLSACAPAPQSQTYTPPYPAKTGIAPVELTAREEFILDSFDLVGSSEILTFNAPKETNSIIISVCTLQEDGTWLEYDGGAVGTDFGRKEGENVTGAFSLRLKDNYALEFKLIDGSVATYNTKEIELEETVMAKSFQFLTELTPVELNKEVPVAIMVYTENGIPTFSMEHYYDTSRFDGLTFVQAVTIEFSDKAIGEI